eukprot:14821799-Ditylum_brightwellii.AAC.1
MNTSSSLEANLICFDGAQSNTVAYVTNDAMNDTTSHYTVNQGNKEFIIEEADDFLSTSFQPEEVEEEVDDGGDNESLDLHYLFIATDAGDIAVEVNEQTAYGFKFSGCNILSNAGLLLAWKQHELKAEGMLFLPIHWKAASDGCSIVGTILSSLLNNAMS